MMLSVSRGHAAARKVSQMSNIIDPNGRVHYRSGAKSGKPE
jgi:hypothetical protein